MHDSLEGSVIGTAKHSNDSPDYSTVVLPLLRSVRRSILEGYGAADFEQKSDFTVVTAIDKEVERRITTGLKAAFPNIGAHGEEYGKSGSQSSYWLLDPIDGTENFIRGLAGFGTILGLVQDGRIVFAALYEPITDSVYWADEKRGAWKNDQRITVADRTIERAMIHVDTSEDTELQMQVTPLLKASKAKIIRMHGSAWRSMLLAEGKLDGMLLYQARGGDWDYAPALFICKIAGAVIRYFDTQDEIAARSCSVLTQSVDNAIGAELERMCVAAMKKHR